MTGKTGLTQVVMLALCVILTACVASPPIPPTETPDLYLAVVASPSPYRTATETPTFYPSQTLPPTPTTFTLTPFNPSGPFLIGYSVSGRPLEVYRFGTGSVERMIVAGIHGGNEWNTSMLAHQMIDYLRDHPEVIPFNITLYILPMLNPDGEARAHGINGRLNDNGVDLNRNWDADWQSEWSMDGCWQYLDVSAGSAPFSEPESQVLRDFILSHHISALISYHSAALGIFPAGSPPFPDSQNFAEAISVVCTYPYPPIDTGCYYTGSLVDWAAAQSMAAVDIELTNHSDTDFDMNLRILDVLLHWHIP